MDKPEQLATQWETKGAIINGQARATGNIERKPKGQS